jgi:glycosyltransferase involved in cell wall biosynthesis
MHELSVILMTRNQAWNLTRLIDSVVSEADPFPESDILVVDAASTDETVQIARRHPVRVLRLRPGDPLTSTAQRYAGYRLTAGEFVLFLGGDLELCKGWLSRAVALLHVRPAAAVVTGPVSVGLSTCRGSLRAIRATSPRRRLLGCTRFRSYGEGLYRRSVLDRVGLPHPYFAYDDGAALWRSIRDGGYELVALRRLMACRHVRPVSYNLASMAAAALRVFERSRQHKHYGLS